MRGHHEGTIFQRKDGRWVALVDQGRVTGKRKRRAYYGATRREVAEQLKVALRSQQQGLPLASDRRTVGDYLTKWSEGAQATVRASTWYRYESLIRGHLLPHLGHLGLSTLQPADCATAFAAMANSA